jgi:hypothetical protein
MEPMQNTSPTEPDTTTRSSTHPKNRVNFVTELAERAVLVPVGAGLTLRDDMVSTVKGLATKYHTRAGLERELKRFEKRGVRARNRFERQVTRRRKRVEREMRHRRRGVERAVKQNRRRLEREVRQVRKDLEKQSGVISGRVGGITGRVEELVSHAQGLMS